MVGWIEMVSFHALPCSHGKKVSPRTAQKGSGVCWHLGKDTSLVFAAAQAGAGIWAVLGSDHRRAVRGAPRHFQTARCHLSKASSIGSEA